MLGFRRQVLTRFLRASEQVQGWFNRESAALWDALLERQTEEDVGGNLLEIGVWKGRSAALLALHQKAKREHLVLVDVYEQREEVDHALRLVGRADRRNVSFLNVNSDLLGRHPELEGREETFRFIHVDGEHTSRGLRADLETADRLLAPRGILAVDDVFSSMYPHLSFRLLDYVRDRPDRLALVLIGFNKAYLVRPGHLAAFSTYLVEDFPREMAAREIPVTIAQTDRPEDAICFGVLPQIEGLANRGPDWDPRAFAPRILGR